MATEAETHAAGPAATHASIAVEPHGAAASGDAHGGGHGGGPMQFAWPMFFWFLAVFLVAFAILKKFAWGPILAGLDKRETDIRQSLENAERIRAELARLDGTCQQRLADADQKAKEILEQARKGAREAAHAIETKAKAEAQILVENARREISFSTQQAQAALRKEAADTAAALAAKILGENLDPAKSSAITDRLIREI